eukprot:s580_g46.t1
MPRKGEAVSAFSAMYPVPLCDFMARGSVRHRELLEQDAPDVPLAKTYVKAVEHSDRRAWHEDPDWVQELCEGVTYKELFRYKFKKSGHINTLECRVYKSWLKHSAKAHPCSRILGLLDSRVTMGAAAKGRSSSRALSRILRGSLGYVLGGALYPGALHCRSAWNRADGPSRDTGVPGPTKEMPLWLSDLQAGKVQRFDVTTKSAFWRNPLGRWVRLLLLLCGDVEENPGPVKKYEPRGELDMSVGFSQTTYARMEKCLAAFSDWLMTEAGTSLDAVLEDVQLTDLALKAYGRALFSTGKPRYWLVYAITSVQHLRPQFRNFLAGAWQVDRKWQVEEPGQCRAVLSAPLVRAIVALSLLWGWHSFATIVSIGFTGMLHPSEFVGLVRSDLIFPEDTLEPQREALYVHIQNPKTARFARRQHVKISDISVVTLARLVFHRFSLKKRLFGGSMAVFRRQWNAVLDYLDAKAPDASNVWHHQQVQDLVLEFWDLYRLGVQFQIGQDGEVKLHIQLPGGLVVDIRAPVGSSGLAADLLRHIAAYEPSVPSGVSEASFELVSEASSVRRAPPARFETRDSILRSFPNCPDRLFRESGRLCGSAVSGRERIQRAWTAGSWAAAVLASRVSSPNRTPTLDLRSRYYAVVSAPGLEAPTIFKSAASYWKLIGNLEDSSSISQSFPSELEAKVYLEAACFPECRIAP